MVPVSEALVINKICHVEITLDNKYQLGASGGGSKTRSRADAIRDNAFIKRRPIGSNSGLVIFRYLRLFDLDGNIVTQI